MEDIEACERPAVFHQDLLWHLYVASWFFLFSFDPNSNITEISSQQHTFFNASREFKLLFYGGSDSHAIRISICAILYIGMVANM